jgi:hypothetical protein
LGAAAALVRPVAAASSAECVTSHSDTASAPPAPTTFNSIALSITKMMAQLLRLMVGSKWGSTSAAGGVGGDEPVLHTTTDAGVASVTPGHVVPTTTPTPRAAAAATAIKSEDAGIVTWMASEGTAAGPIRSEQALSRSMSGTEQAAPKKSSKKSKKKGKKTATKALAQ